MGRIVSSGVSAGRGGDVVRYLGLFLFAGAVLGSSVADAADDQNTLKPEALIQRGYGQHDACFGDKYESDEDLKTGNELSVEQILELLTQPGA